MSKKVMQTASVDVKIVADDSQVSLAIAGLTALSAVRNQAGQLPYEVTTGPVSDWSGHHLIDSNVAYTAKGANRDDINRKVREFVDNVEWLWIAPRATITKLGV